MPPVRDHHVVSPCVLPYTEHLRAADNLRNKTRVMSDFGGYTQTIPAVCSMD